MELHLLDRGRLMADRNLALDGAVVATHDDRSPELAYDAFVVWNLLIDHPEATVLWDTGVHPEAAEGYWPDRHVATFAPVDAAERDLETALGDVGYGLGDVDLVVQSHLHLDHAGGLHRFAGTDVPVYVHRRELEHAYLSAKTDAGGDGYWLPDFDRDLAWRVLDVSGDRRRRLRPGIDLLHLPGHTPGLLGAHLRRDHAEDVIVAGDQAFLAPNFEADRSMGASLLYDSRAVAENNRRLRELQRRAGGTVLYGHDPDQFERLRGGL